MQLCDLGGGLASANDLTSPTTSTEQYEALTPAERIDRIADGKLQAFGGTINIAAGVYLDDVYAQNKSVAEHTAADYHGRFLIELVQNANDAHERGQRDGQIDVLLVEDEGDFGTLYVANFGKPFSHDDVVALSRIGMPTKPPGESIGNKGLGFRSVSHVCDAPEIYSQAPEAFGAATFEGSTPETLTLARGAYDFCVFIPINIGSADYRERGNPVLPGGPSTKSEGDPN
jgi:hypothetical protein